MALTDFLTQIADSIRSKDGSVEVIKATDFPQRILSIPSGGGSGLPSNVKTGTFTVAEDTIETITIPHGLGTTPIHAFIFPDNADVIMNKLGYSFLGGSSTIPYHLITDYVKNFTYKNGVFDIAVDETNIVISTSKTTCYFRAGVTYRWFAWEASA